MHYLIIADTHDHHSNLAKVLEEAKSRGITTGIHLGDFAAPPLVTLLVESGMQWYTIFGNCDGDRLSCYLRAQAGTNVSIENAEFRELELEDNRKVFLTHYPKVAQEIAGSETYDACFYGHNHQRKCEMVGKTLLANPGEVCANLTGVCSFGIYKSEDNSFEIVEL